MKGTIKKIIQNRGFGFIDSEDQEEDIFFHQSNIQETELSRLRLGQRVEYEIEDTPKGPQAVNITLTE